MFVYGVTGPFRGTVRDLGWGNVPVWSPDGTEVVISVQERAVHRQRQWQGTHLYRLRMDQLQELRPFESTPTGDINRMAWAPDGRRLVFSSER